MKEITTIGLDDERIPAAARECLMALAAPLELVKRGNAFALVLALMPHFAGPSP